MSNENPRETKVIALGAGGEDGELSRRGYGLEHVNEALIRISRRLLESGYRLAYGGTLTKLDDNLTLSLIDLATTFVNENGDTLRESPLVNYAPWPFHRFVKKEQEASLVGICDFIRFDPHKAKLEEVNADPSPRETDAPAQLLISIATADALTRMRKQIAEDTDAAVLMAGKIKGAKGAIPGLAQEFMYQWKTPTPVYLIGGFGGCIGEMVDFLLGDSEEFPELLRPDAAGDSTAQAKLMDSDYAAEINTEQAAFEKTLREARVYFKAVEAEREDPMERFGLDGADLMLLMRTQSVAHMGKLVRRGLGEVGDGAASSVGTTEDPTP